jgi:hypothetical protein
MIKLFSEKVTPFTSSNLNIIQVESFDEVFFDVYEFEINGNKYIAEKIGDYSGDPVVSVPIVEGSSRLEAPFILRKGKFEVYYNPSNSKFLETITEEVDSVIELPVIKEEVEEELVIIPEKKDKILEEINTAKQQAVEAAQREKERLLKEAVDEIKVKNDLIKEEVESIKQDLINDFYQETINSKEELSAYNEKKEQELTDFVKLIVKDKLKALQDKVNTSSDLAKANLTKDVAQLAESLKLTLNSKQQDLSTAVISLVREEFDKVVKVVDHAIDKKSKILDTKLYGQVQRQRHELLALEKANVELNDNINKANNKALSRIGNVKKELEASLIQAEQRVKNFYGDRIKTIEEGLFEGSKEEILNIVRGSRESILEEIINIKTDIPAIAEARSNVSTLKKDIEKSISEKFTNEMQSIKRLIEMSSGGGSVAAQFAAGGTMNGDLNVTGNILSGGVNLDQLFGAGGGGSGTIGGSGTANTITIWSGVSSISDSIMVQTSDGIVINGDLIPNTTLAYDLGSSTKYWSNLYLTGNINGDVTFTGNITGANAHFNEITALTANFTQTIVSTTSSLSIINAGTGPALFVKQDGSEPIVHFIDRDGDDIVFADDGYVGIGVFNPSEKLTVVGNISASGTTTSNVISAGGRVEGQNISTIESKIEGLYSYLINNFDTNQIVTATDLTDFVNNYPKTGLVPGDVITLSATNTAFILGDRDGSSNSDWFEVNLKPNFLFYRQGLSDYGVLDTFPLSGAKSAKYIIQVEDKTDNSLFYGEVNVVSDGTIAVATEYGLNHTTVFPFVEFGAQVVSNNHIALSAIALDGKTMSNFIFKGNRSNLFS